MAVVTTFTPDANDSVSSEGAKRVEYGTLTLTGTYVNPGGEAVSGGLFRMARVDRIEFLEPTLSSGYVPTYSSSTTKIKCWYGDYNNAADGPLIEAANGATVTGTIPVRVVGVGL